MSPAFSKKTSCAFNTFIQSLPSVWSFTGTLERTKIITLPKIGKYHKFPQNLHPIGLLSIMGKIFEKLILRTIQKHTDERN
jgi:hypothetical protein